MPELGPYGSVRGARGNSRPYRESPRRRAKPTRLTLNGLSAASILLDPKVVRFRTIDGPYWSFPDVLSSAEVVDPC